MNDELSSDEVAIQLVMLIWREMGYEAIPQEIACRAWAAALGAARGVLEYEASAPE